MKSLKLRAYCDQARAIANHPNGGSVKLTDLVRMYPRWRMEMSRSPMRLGIPWTTYASIEFMETILKPGHQVFEYGSGGSTVFFSDRCAGVISVEHDPEWAKAVQDMLKTRSITNVDFQLIEPVKGAVAADVDAADPTTCASGQAPYEDCSFADYVHSIDRYPDDSFDLVVVDGRSRQSCLVDALPKVKPGGWIVLDDAERARYQRAQSCLPESDWKSVDNIGPGPCKEDFANTKAWQKLPSR